MKTAMGVLGQFLLAVWNIVQLLIICWAGLLLGTMMMGDRPGADAWFNVCLLCAAGSIIGGKAYESMKTGRL